METRRDIEAQALDWLVRLDSESLPDSERARFDAWIAENASHHVAFLRAEAAWKRADRLKRLRPLDGAVDEDLLEPAPPAMRSRLRSPVWLSLAAAACVAILGVAVWMAVQSYGWHTYDTAVGSTERTVPVSD